ncbi:MAG: hypothetical protein HFJ05_09420 [Eubacterium sp.]|nr:hypothetical protein [Eubacterium sp.]
MSGIFFLPQTMMLVMQPVNALGHPSIDSEMSENLQNEERTAASSAEYGIFILSRISSEGVDGDASAFGLSETESRVFEAYADAF